LGNPNENQRDTVCKEVKDRFNDIERQTLFANLSEKRSLIFYRDMKLLWDRGDYVMCGSMNDRMGIAWFGAGIWKLRGIRKCLETGRCRLYNGEKDAIHVLLKCPETRRLREHLLSIKVR
jgi:hypothetical protein